MLGDFLASIKPWPIDGIHIHGEHFTVPALTADAWLEQLLPDEVELWNIVPGMLAPAPQAREAVVEAMLCGELSREGLEELVWEIVGIAAGRDWWTVLVLLGHAKAYSARDLVAGRLVLAGVDATRISFSAWLDAVYLIFLDRLTDAQRQQFNAALIRPPRGATEVKIDRKRAVAAFQAVMASM